MTTKKNSNRFIKMLAALVLLSISGISHALVLAVNDHEGFTEYLGITGVLTGRNAPWRMLVPDDWNGTLMVYSRGTGSAVKVDPDGTPVLDPSGLPIIATTPLANVPHQDTVPGNYD